MSKTYSATRRVRIVDGATLRRVLQTVYDHHGTHRSAASWLRIDQSTFTRLLNGKTHQFMSFETYSSISRALDGHALEFGLIEDFELSVVAWEGGLVVRRYEEWVARELRRLEEAGARELLQELYAHSTYASYFEDFLRRTNGRSSLPQPDEHRLWMALYRAVEPLTAAEFTWGVERSWTQLGDSVQPGGQTELESYLRTALRRERIVLNRERVLERIRSEGLVPPPEYWAGGVDPRDLAEGNALPDDFWDYVSVEGESSVEEADSAISDDQVVEGTTNDRE
jgi:hypothetical protein